MTTIILGNNDVVNVDYDVVIAVVVNVVAAVRVCMSLCGLLASIFGEEKNCENNINCRQLKYLMTDWLLRFVVDVH